MDVIKSVLKALGPILTIALLCVAAYFLFFAGPELITLFADFAFLPAAITTLELSPVVIGVAALGAALILDPEGVGEIAGKIAETIGKVAGKVVAGVVGGVSGALFGMPLSTVLLLGVGAYLLYGYFSRDKEPDLPQASTSEALPAPVASDQRTYFDADSSSEGYVYGQ